MPVDPITTTGEVLHRYSENAFKVSLPNGKEIIGHPAKALADRKDQIVPGTRVSLEMTPFDFEKGRIVDFK
ncbi:MAG: translation initiation factor IF-1 [Akkermansiaceae bacterium]